MSPGQSLLFFFSSLGVFNGLLMGLYFLFFTRPGRIQNRYFGLLLLSLTIRIGKSTIYFFHRDLPPTFLQIGLSGCLFIGPLLYLYLRSMIRASKQSTGKDIGQLAGWGIIMLVIGLLFPYAKRPELWNPEIVQGIYAVWVIYVIASARLLQPLFGILLKKPAELTIEQKWLLVVFGTNTLICLVFNSVLYLGFPSYIFGPITFSFVFYVLLAFLLFYPGSKTLIEGKKPRYNQRKIDIETATSIKDGLWRLMNEERRFTDPLLKLKDLASELKVSPHILSQYLNENCGKRFTEYINEYRVEAACRLLRTEHNLSLEGVGREVGFRSKSSFYNAFKKHHGTTPLQYARPFLSRPANQ